MIDIMDIDKTLIEIKKDFIRFRNGIIAENLKAAYNDDIMIYGLMVPEFLILSKKYQKDKNLAFRLWHDLKSRESRIFALYMMPPEELDMETAKKMILEVRNLEEAELLPFRLLRNLSFAQSIFEEMKSLPDLSKPQSYCVEMLGRNIGQI